MKFFIKIVSVSVLLLLCTAFLSGVETISVTDLTVSSSNPKYEYIGKGLGELISYELGKSGDVVLVEREKRAELLEEMNMSLTGLTDESSQLELGKLLSVKYLVSGDIIDMDSMLLITVKLIDVESGQILLKENVSESLGNYSYISGYFAKAILEKLGAKIDTSTAVAVEKKETRDEEAAIAISNAIDSYDKKDTESAKKNLAVAKELDPENEVVDLYLQKLSPTSPKYKVQLEIYGNSQNPAVLGVIRQDRVFAYLSAPADMSKDEMKSVGDSFSMGEQYMAQRLGFEVPLGEKLGVSAEFTFGALDNKVEAPFTFDVFDDTNVQYFHDLERSYGGNFGLGYMVNDMLSVGVGVHLFWNQIISVAENNDETVFDENLETAVDLGFLVRNSSNSLVFDSHVVYTTQEQYYLDVDDQISDTDSLPIITESTLTTAFLDRKLFFVLKGLTDVFHNKRSGIVVRAIPVVEYWPVGFLSLRGGYQFTYLNIDDSTDSGHGFMAGTTVRLGKIDLDINYTSRYQPSKVLPGYGKTETFLLFGISRSGNMGNLSR